MTLSERVARIEAWLTKQEAVQQAAAQRLDDTNHMVERRISILDQRMAAKDEAMADRIGAKDETIKQIRDMSESIQKQNDALQKQITGRWSVATGMMSFVAIMFALNFAYEIYRVKEVMDAKSALEQGTKSLATNAGIYSEVLDELARADTLITQGHRELLRNSYHDAEDMVTDAIGLLQRALEKTSNTSLVNIQANRVYNSSKCEIIEGPDPVKSYITSIIGGVRTLYGLGEPSHDKPNDIQQGINPRGLANAVMNSLYTAYDLKASSILYRFQK